MPLVKEKRINKEQQRVAAFTSTLQTTHWLQIIMVFFFMDSQPIILEKLPSFQGM